MTNGNDTTIGLTKRELFAAMALQGLLLYNNNMFSINYAKAVEAADALIEALNKPNKTTNG